MSTTITTADTGAGLTNYGSEWSTLSGVVRGVSYACQATGHDFRQAGDGNSGLPSNLLFCSKCGDVRELKLETPE